MEDAHGDEDARAAKRLRAFQGDALAALRARYGDDNVSVYEDEQWRIGVLVDDSHVLDLRLTDVDDQRGSDA